MGAGEVRCSNCNTRNRLPVVTGGKPRCGKCQTPLPWLVEADESEFDAAIAESSLPVLVDLWAPWCGPCKMVAPALEELSRERAGSLRVLKLNVDEAPRRPGDPPSLIATARKVRDLLGWTPRYDDLDVIVDRLIPAGA